MSASQARGRLAGSGLTAPLPAPKPPLRLANRRRRKFLQLRRRQNNYAAMGIGLRSSCFLLVSLLISFPIHIYVTMRFAWHVCVLPRLPMTTVPVMTRSTLSPEPIPAPAQPWTDPRCFIVDAPCVASCHMTCSHHMHLQRCVSTSW